jgi:hypothetical protein
MSLTIVYRGGETASFNGLSELVEEVYIQKGLHPSIGLIPSAEFEAEYALGARS